MFENTVLNIELFNQLFYMYSDNGKLHFKNSLRIFWTNLVNNTETSPYKSDPDFHLTYSKIGEIWGRNQNDKNR